jgi:predicted transposase YbfD/YdcC
MGEAPDAKSFMAIFDSIKDPRIERSRLHPLSSVLLLCLCAVLSGANTVVEMEQYGIEKRAFLETLASFPHGIPSHDTICRILAKLNPGELQRLFALWMNSVADLSERSIIAIDGKALRRSFDTASGTPFVHMVSAFATANKMVLGQTCVDAKSGEATTIPFLLRLVDIRGALVTIDAAGCNIAIATQIVDDGADFMLATKKNQPKLLNAIENAFEQADIGIRSKNKVEKHESKGRGHGRSECRRVTVIKLADQTILPEAWRIVKTLIRVESTRSAENEANEATRFYISSANLSAQEAGEVVRAHWAIENNLHWTLDVAFREDDSRMRSENAAENYGVIRHIGLDLLRNMQGRKSSIMSRRKMAGWNNDVVLQLLGTGGLNLAR